MPLACPAHSAGGTAAAPRAMRGRGATWRRLASTCGAASSSACCASGALLCGKLEPGARCCTCCAAAHPQHAISTSRRSAVLDDACCSRPAMQRWRGAHPLCGARPCRRHVSHAAGGGDSRGSCSQPRSWSVSRHCGDCGRWRDGVVSAAACAMSFGMLVLCPDASSADEPAAAGRLELLTPARLPCNVCAPAQPYAASSRWSAGGRIRNAICMSCPPPCLGTAPAAARPPPLPPSWGEPPACLVQVGLPCKVDDTGGSRMHDPT